MSLIEDKSIEFPFGANRKKRVVITSAGTVVYAILRMCVNKDIPATAGAKFVVSESGDILSPKQAPLIIAPAAKVGEIPVVTAIPIKATPMVLTVVNELPVNIETMIVTYNALTAK
ncbi:hypothetical protein D3C76_1261020 [compost metagenome]